VGWGAERAAALVPDQLEQGLDVGGQWTTAGRRGGGGVGLFIGRHGENTITRSAAMLPVVDRLPLSEGWGLSRGGRRGCIELEREKTVKRRASRRLRVNLSVCLGPGAGRRNWGGDVGGVADVSHVVADWEGIPCNRLDLGLRFHASGWMDTRRGGVRASHLNLRESPGMMRYWNGSGGSILVVGRLLLLLLLTAASEFAGWMG
jgi:hypothetical protein